MLLEMKIWVKRAVILAEKNEIYNKPRKRKNNQYGFMTSFRSENVVDIYILFIALFYIHIVI